MAMVKVKVRVQVKQGSVRSEEFESTLDEASASQANCDSGRAKLDSWAKNMFPAAEWVKVTEVRKV